MTDVKVIKDSISPDGNRITTMELKYARYILAEFNTHRVFCLHEDSKLYFNTDSELETKKIKIKDLFDKDLNQLRLRSLNEDTHEIIETKIKKIFFSGKKQIFQINLENGFFIKCTNKHRIFTDKGWTTLESIDILDNYKIACDISSDKCDFKNIISVYPLGYFDTYDVEVEGKWANFISDGVVVHNSRSSASSRAIPIKKMINQVMTDPVIPVHWGKNKPGMQADEELYGWKLFSSKFMWKLGAISACAIAFALNKIGLHKQIANRILEPWQYARTIVTSTEWDNFFELRLHSDAQPEMFELASKMKEALNNSIPHPLNYGEWHLPYVSLDETLNHTLTNLIIMSVARCARVSYLNHDGSIPNLLNDVVLYEKLVGSDPKHMSPSEHQATPIPENNFQKNFKGWKPFRSFIEDNQYPFVR